MWLPASRGSVGSCKHVPARILKRVPGCSHIHDMMAGAVEPVHAQYGGITPQVFCAGRQAYVDPAAVASFSFKRPVAMQVWLHADARSVARKSQIPAWRGSSASTQKYWRKYSMLTRVKRNGRTGYEVFRVAASVQTRFCPSAREGCHMRAAQKMSQQAL